jgi:hypothetical protein
MGVFMVLGLISPSIHGFLAQPLSFLPHTANELAREGSRMRVLLVIGGSVALMHGALDLHAQPQMPLGRLVREVVYNELNDHKDHGYWRYWIEKHSQGQTLVEDQIETSQGPVTRLIRTDGQPLSPEAQQQEQARLERLLNSPKEQARHQKQYNEDEDRIGRILALLPDAFIYEYAGEEDGCYRLNFHPNPDYPPHTIEARIFHAMSGSLWVDARLKRLVRLDTRVEDNVDFGFGILGRLYKGGWFHLQRKQVSATDWKTEQLEMHMNVRALLVKTFAKETSERRGGFVPVQPGMNLAQGMSLMNQSENQAQMQPQTRPAPAARSLTTPAALAVLR